MSALANSRLPRSAAVAVVAGGAIAAAVGHSSAAPAKTEHTLRMVTTQIADHQVGYYDVAANKDTQHGKVVGFDTTSCFINIHTHIAKCEISVSRANGTFRGKANINVDTGVGTGTITGGTRAFRGVTGTLTGKSISANKTLVTVHYHS